MAHESSERGRLIIVSNRLPFTAGQVNGQLTFHESTGGVVTGLGAYLDTVRAGRGTMKDYVWVGWPGSAIDIALRAPLKEKAFSDFHSHPVFLSGEEMENFYHGFCNKTIWPLFHYFPTYTSFHEEHWQHYKRVNEMFCDAILEIVDTDDTVWIHDYHLMLLPGLVKARRPEAQIGFFLHIPFPSFEIFRLLPGAWRREILEGLLGADLIGFHTYSYTQHFLQCVLRILGHENNMGQILLPSRIVKSETFPMGIDFTKFHDAVNNPEVQKEREFLKKSLMNVTTILSVDRLDYTKGVLNRLRGFDLLLEQNPQFREKVVLIMDVVPSRIGVDQYEQMKKQIEELVGNINGKYGGIGWTPIIYQYRQIPFAPLVALYTLSDIALVTPLRDGMNLVAKEYVASRRDKTGTLIVSEMAGAAKELAEAIIINPHHTQEIAQALRDALEMPVQEQRRRNTIMQKRLRRYDVVRWANDFVDQLLAMKQVQKKFEARVLHTPARMKLLSDYRQSSRRLLFLDYDGTLTPFVPQPQLARPGRDLLALLRTLAADPKNTVVLISGRDRFTLEKWFAEVPMALVAEHGAWVKERGRDWAMLKQQVNAWKSRIIPILESYADRLPGAFVEEKEYSVVWHYRSAYPEQGQVLARELIDHLVTFTANIDIQVLQGHKVIEVRTAGVDKGAAGLRWMGKDSHDFILAVGDDLTDEDLFKAVPESAYSIRVGVTNSHARFNLRDSRDVIELLNALAAEDSPDTSGKDTGHAKTRQSVEGVMKTRSRRTLAALGAFGVILIPVLAKLFSKQSTT